MMTKPSETLFSPHLLQDEQILWTGAPPDENADPVRSTKATNRHSRMKGIAVFCAAGAGLVALVVFGPNGSGASIAGFAAQVLVVALTVMLLGSVLFIASSSQSSPDYGRVWMGQEHYAITDRRLLVVCGDERYSLFGRRALTSIEVSGRGQRQSLVLHSAEEDDETASYLREVERASEAERLLLKMFTRPPR